MKKISDFFPEISAYYFLDQGKVFNQKTKKHLKPDPKYCFRLRTIGGGSKCLSIKTLYRVIEGVNFCIDDIPTLRGEEWRYIPNTNKMYMCSSEGRVKSLIGVQARLLSAATTARGYKRLQITLTDGSLINKFVHSLVIESFDPEADLGADRVIHHINRDRSDNRLVNLQVLSRADHNNIHKKINNQEKEILKNECA